MAYLGVKQLYLLRLCFWKETCYEIIHLTCSCAFVSVLSVVVICVWRERPLPISSGKGKVHGGYVYIIQCLGESLGQGWAEGKPRSTGRSLTVLL